MKNLSLVAALIILLIAGGILGYIVTRPADQLPTPSIPVSTTPTAPTSIDEAGQYYEITGSYPSVTPLRTSVSTVADAKAVSSMQSWVNDIVDSFMSDSGVTRLTPEDIKIMGLDQGRKYTLDLKYETHSSLSTVSYVFLVYEDTLGAHPNAFYKTFTFDLKTGAELSIADLFTPGTHYLDYLSEHSRSMLRTQIAKASAIKESEVDTSMLNGGTKPVTASFAWFYLEGSNLVLIFPPYSVGPWVIGEQLVTFKTSELKEYLKEGYL